MVVGILQVELTIEWSESLKDKRRVVQSLKDKLHREHQVSVAEVGELENRRVAVLGVVMAGSGVDQCQRTLDHVLNKFREAKDCVLSDHSTQILSGCGP